MVRYTLAPFVFRASRSFAYLTLRVQYKMLSANGDFNNDNHAEILRDVCA